MRCFLLNLTLLLVSFGLEAVNAQSPSVTSAQSSSAEGKKYALIIGISGGIVGKDAPFPAERQLKYAHNDAKQFNDFIQSPEGGSFPAVNIRFLTNADATRDRIAEELEWLSKQVRREDTVFIFFSGHGMEDENGIVYFMPYGSDYQHPSVRGLRANHFLKDLSERVNSQHLIIFIDACHAAAATTKDGTTKGEANGVNAALKKNWEEAFKGQEASSFAFFSASANQRSWEDVEKQEGVFTWFLLEGLKGAADLDQNKVVTAGELHRYLLDKVGVYTKGKFGSAQTPLVSPGFNEKFPLAAFSLGDLYGRGVAAYERKDYKEAVELLTQALKDNAGYSLAYYHRGSSKMELGDNQGAIADYDLALTLDPKLANAYTNRGTSKDRTGNQKGAIADYDLAISLDPKLALAYFNRGVVKQTLGDHWEALSDYTKAISLVPLAALAYRNRGALKYILADKQGALTDFTQAILLDPKNANSYYDCGVIKAELGDKQGAVVDFTQALALDPKQVNAYNNRGNAKAALGNNQGAIADYNQAITLDPKHADAYSNRGIAKSALGDKQGAIADYNQAIAFDPKHAKAYNNRGNANAALGEMESAIADYSAALALDPKEPKFYRSRGVAKLAIKDEKGAIVDLQNAAQLGDQVAQQWLKERGISW